MRCIITSGFGIISSGFGEYFRPYGSRLDEVKEDVEEDPSLSCSGAQGSSSRVISRENPPCGFGRVASGRES